MGCCNVKNSFEEIIQRILSDISLSNITYEEIKEILNRKLTPIMYLEEFKSKISGNNIKEFEISVNQISEENFKKISKEIILIQSKSVESILVKYCPDFLNCFITKIYQYSKGFKYIIIYNLFILLKGSPNEKLENFWELIIILDPELNYLKFKNLMYDYIKNSLCIASIALTEACINEKLAYDNKYFLENIIDNDSIKSFVYSFLEDFENSKFNNVDESSEIELPIMKKLEYKTNLEKKADVLFDFCKLRQAYYLKFGF